MTVAPSRARAEILKECLPLLAELRELNAKGFQAKQFIALAIDEYEAGLRKLAALREGSITEDRRNGEGPCAACGASIANIRPRPGGPIKLFLCEDCADLFMRAHHALHSFEGFGTVAI
ncbi:MAG TPA: hypothetical protein VF950_21420 [Planctomycetota bacterium]